MGTRRPKRPSGDEGSGLESEAELRRHFMGKRDGFRSRVDLAVVVEGRGAQFEARAVDLSRSGILLKITDPRFAPAGRSIGLVEYCNRIVTYFEQGLNLQFFGGALKRRATPIRVANQSLGVEEPLLLACRFAAPLDGPACALLGLDRGEDRVREGDPGEGY
ncbi:MAG: PilZ domain-containing protein [Planctomycetaceae bacterium]